MAYRELDTAIVGDAPALRRLAVKLGGLKLLGLLVKCTPCAFFTRDMLETSVGGNSEGADFASNLWSAAASLDLLEAAPQAYLTGKMLMDLGVKPGKQMGEIIKQSFELQLDGEIKNADEAVAWARSAIST